MKSDVFGVWPIATNTPVTGTSVRSPVLLSRTTIAGHLALAAVHDLLDLAVEQPRDLRVRARLVLHDLRRAQRVAAMHDRHLGREPREEHRLFHRRVAAADHRDLLAAEEVAVARRAGRDAVAHQRALGRQAQQPRRRAGRDDERASSCTRRSDVVTDERLRARDRPRVTLPWMISAPNFSACARISAIRSGPMMPSR